MQQEVRDAEALRRRLYRPGASPADLADYLHVAEAERPEHSTTEETATTPPVVRSLRPLVIGGSVVAGAALLGAVLLTSGRTAPTATPTVAAASAVPTQVGNGSQVTFTVVDVLDGGAIEHARGVATQDGPEMYRYVVASGDSATAVADRFGLCSADVIQVLPYGFDPGRLPVGATLELVHYDANSC